MISAHSDVDFVYGCDRQFRELANKSARVSYSSVAELKRDKIVFDSSPEAIAALEVIARSIKTKTPLFILQSKPDRPAATIHQFQFQSIEAHEDRVLSFTASERINAENFQRKILFSDILVIGPATIETLEVDRKLAALPPQFDVPQTRFADRWKDMIAKFKRAFDSGEKIVIYHKGYDPQISMQYEAKILGAYRDMNDPESLPIFLLGDIGGSGLVAPVSLSSLSEDLDSFSPDPRPLQFPDHFYGLHEHMSEKTRELLSEIGRTDPEAGEKIKLYGYQIEEAKSRWDISTRVLNKAMQALVQQKPIEFLDRGISKRAFVTKIFSDRSGMILVQLRSLDGEFTTYSTIFGIENAKAVPKKDLEKSLTPLSNGAQIAVEDSDLAEYSDHHPYTEVKYSDYIKRLAVALREGHEFEWVDDGNGAARKGRIVKMSTDPSGEIIVTLEDDHLVSTVDGLLEQSWTGKAITRMHSDSVATESYFPDPERGHFYKLSSDPNIRSPLLRDSEIEKQILESIQKGRRINGLKILRVDSIGGRVYTVLTESGQVQFSSDFKFE